MAKYTPIRLTQLSANESAAVDVLNRNLNAIQENIDDSVSRTAKTPSQMLADLDMNGHKIQNLGKPTQDTDVVRLIDVVKEKAAIEQMAKNVLTVGQETMAAIENATETVEEAAEEVERLANFVKFGMRRQEIRISDWQISNGVYTIFLADVGIVDAVYKGDKLVNVDIETSDSGTTLKSLSAFNGYCLIADNINKQQIYTQSEASDTWTITHNLGEYPKVTTIDDNNTVMIGTVQYTNLNELVITFTEAVSGKAILD